MAKSAAVTAIQAELRETEARANALRQALQALGGLSGGGTRTTTAGQRRARKRPKMSAAQRKAVGERMKKYWAAKRKAKKVQ